MEELSSILKRMPNIPNAATSDPHPPKQTPPQNTKGRGGKQPSVWIPTYLFYEILSRDFSKNELIVILWISRFQFGFQYLKFAKIAKKMFKHLGINERTFDCSARELRENGVITKFLDVFTIQLDTTKWRVPVKKNYDEDIVKALEIKHVNLQKDDRQKSA